MSKMKISGGIFFALLTEIRITDENRSNRMNGSSEQCTNLDLLNSIGSIIGKEYTEKNISKKTASYYKTCEGQGGLNFHTVECGNYFKLGITKHYNLLYRRTALMIQKCLVNDVEQRKLFTSKLLYILDNATNLEDVFFYYPNNDTKLTSKQLVQLTEFDFTSLILAVWQALVFNITNNTVAEDTFNKLFMLDFRKSEYFFKEEYLKDLKNDFSLINCISEIEPIHIEENEFFEAEISVDESKINTDYYETYLKNYVEKISKLKTILYLKQPVDFYHIYVCNDICLDTNYKDSNKDSNSPLISATPKSLIDRYGRFLTLSAPGGYGKSMFLKHMMLCEYRFREADWMEPCGLVPILLSLKDFKKKHKSIEEFIFEKIRKYDSSIDFAVFKKDLSKGIFMFLFDALDEVDNELIDEFISGFNDFSDQYDSNVYILSSRPNNICDSLTQFIALKLMHFRQQQAVKLINRFTDFSEEKRTSFNKRMFNNPKLRFNSSSVEDNPLLLTIKFLIYIQTGEFVKSETATFYEKAYEVLYITHDQVHSQYSGRKYYTNLDQDDLAYAIGEFCYKMYFSFKYSFTRSDIDDVIKEMELAKKHNFNTTAFIIDLKDNLTIMYFEDGKYSFMHRSFQEYFTAYYLSKQSQSFFTPLVVSSFSNYSKNRHHKEVEIRGNKKSFFFIFHDCEIENIIKMLHQIKPESVEKYLFLPALKDIFSNHRNPSIYSYIESVYKSISYSKGHVQISGYNEPKSEIIRFIVCSLLEGDYYHEIVDGPIYDEFIDTYFYTDEDGQQEDEGEYRKEYDEQDDVWHRIEPDGYLLEFEIADILTDSTKYGELFSLLDDEFAEEFSVINHYFKNLLERYK